MALVFTYLYVSFVSCSMLDNISACFIPLMLIQIDHCIINITNSFMHLFLTDLFQVFYDLIIVSLN